MRKKVLGTIALLVLLSPQWAMAHVPIKGINDFYNGLLHPFFSLPHLLALVALGILMGRYPEKDSTRILYGFILSLAVALGFATFSMGFGTASVLVLSACILGFLILLNLTIPVWCLLLLSILLGLLMGFDFASEQVKSKAALNVGTGITLYICLLGVAAFSEAFNKKKWQQIGLRVIGSWITACALMVLSLTLLAKKP